MEFVIDRLLLPAIAGIVGWFSTHFVLRQVLAFHELRQRSHETVFFTNNVAEDSTLVSGGPDRYSGAVEEVRRLAAKMTALHVAASPFTRAYFRLRGFNVHDAAVELTSLSNSLGRGDGSALTARQRLGRALRLPRHGLYE